MASPGGVEPTAAVEFAAKQADPSSSESTRVDASTRKEVDAWPSDRVHSASTSVTVDVLRAKLDAAILAEDWEAVKIVNGRLRVAEIAAADTENVIPIGGRKPKR